MNLKLLSIEEEIRDEQMFNLLGIVLKFQAIKVIKLFFF